MAEEKNFENRIKKFLKGKGWIVYKFFGCAMTEAGVPDLLCCSTSGRFVGIEVKASNGRPSALQIDNLKKINAIGGIGILLYPKDWDDFKKKVENGEI